MSDQKKWTVSAEDGYTIIRDGNRMVRHSSASHEMLATHFAGALQELDRRYAQIQQLASALRYISGNIDDASEVVSGALECLKERMTAIHMDGSPDEQVVIDTFVGGES